MKASALDDVIAAISTAAGSGGIGIVRMSGEGAIDVADKIFKSQKGYRLKDKKAIQFLMALYIILRQGKLPMRCL